MIIKVTPKKFQEYLRCVSFQNCGDYFEKNYGAEIIKNFPNCEKFWRVFVVPFTERISRYPEHICDSINVREGIDTDIEKVANSHYSMFIHLVYAHNHLQNKMLSSLENIYMHMASVSDLAEMTIFNWYFLLLQCQGKESKIAQNLQEDEFVEIARVWYRSEYQKLYNYYLNKGKCKPTRLPQKPDILKEYFGEKSQSRIRYCNSIRDIRFFRNKITHDVKIARIITSESNHQLIPKQDLLENYLDWKAVEAVKDNNKIIQSDFIEAFQQAENDLLTIERDLNALWEKMIEDFTQEFKSDRDTLRRKYAIEFGLENQSAPSNDITFVNRRDHENRSDDIPIPGSGISTQGTALYNSSIAPEPAPPDSSE